MEYENPNNFEIQPGLNAISFLVRAIFKYNNVLRIALYVNGNKYYHVSNRIVINKNKQLDIYYFEQLDILNKIILYHDVGVKRSFDPFDTGLLRTLCSRNPHII